jgi:hypothetical protein
MKLKERQASEAVFCAVRLTNGNAEKESKRLNGSYKIQCSSYVWSQRVGTARERHGVGF